jgi:hypothetical protein
MIADVNAKKVLIIVVLASVLFFMFSAPADAAQLVKQTAELAWNLMRRAAQSMQTFVTTLSK